MKELIKSCIADIVRKLAPDFKGEILVEIPENKNFGDYTTNVAFSLAKVLKKSPQAAAEDLAKRLLKDSKPARSEFSKIEAAAGFVNFFLSPFHLQHEILKILKTKNKYGFSKIGSGKKVQVEFISANPTGPLTIGNGRGGFYGDVLANVLSSQGYKVSREYYINDRGEQVKNLGLSIKIAQGEKILGVTEYLYHGEYVKDLAKKIEKNLTAEEAGQKAVELVMGDYIKPSIKKFGIKFDKWFSEKTLYLPSHKAPEGRGKKGGYEKAMDELQQSGWVYEKDGATWLKTSGFGDNEDRVLIKKDGAETYFLSDILYHFDKFKIRKFDKIIDIWGADHHGYAPRLKAALKMLNIPEENLDIVITQLVRLVSGGKEMKISKRAGVFITLDELVGEVGKDSARFFFLMYSPDTHMDFDIALAKERSQKNPVYYVQYAHARIASIFAKVKTQKLKVKILSQNLKLLNTESEFGLIRNLSFYPELLADIADKYEVHRLPRYALELAREFHNFYEKERVISENKNLTSARLALVMAAKTVLANILNLMGIKAPDKM